MRNRQFTECLLCGGRASLKHPEYPGYQEPATFAIYHCGSCGTAFSFPRVATGEIYETIYRNGESVPGYHRYWEYAEIIKEHPNPLDFLSHAEEAYWGVTEALSLLVTDRASTRILEIGSGLGYLTYSLLRANYDATGLDISATAVMHAIETFGNHYVCSDLFEYAHLHPESFHIVILTELIEHVERPLGFLEAVLGMLKPNGQVIVTTPNKSLYPSSISWATELPPVHCWWFSEDSMTYIADRTNLDIRFIDFSRYYRDSYRLVDLKARDATQVPHPILGRNGELIDRAVRQPAGGRGYLRFLMRRVPFLRSTYIELKRLMKPDVIVCAERGIVLCAIMQKR